MVITLTLILTIAIILLEIFQILFLKYCKISHFLIIGACILNLLTWYSPFIDLMGNIIIGIVLIYECFISKSSKNPFLEYKIFDFHN